MKPDIRPRFIKSLWQRELPIALSWLLPLILLNYGCSLNRFYSRKEQQVFEADVDKTQLVKHLNRNILGTETTPGVSAWKTSDAKIQVTGIPISLPASMAVEAPRNLRILVTNPLGGQEVDLGSNDQRFWIWTKEQTEMITCRHEDTELALQHFEMPIQIQPEWLMEVFGVVPVNADEYTMERPDPKQPIVELIANRTSPTGQQVERVIRVNTFSGNIEQHLLRNSSGEVLATASLDKYTKMPNGTVLPTFVKINWPAAKTEMKISLGHPEVNPPSFASSHALWTMPEVQGSKVVDIGHLSRQAIGQNREGVKQSIESGATPVSQVRQLQHSQELPFGEPPGKVALNPTTRLEAPAPAGGLSNSLAISSRSEEAFQFNAATPPRFPTQNSSSMSNEEGLPEWARGHQVERPITLPTSQPAAWQPSTSSPATWRSSSVPRPQELE